MDMNKALLTGETLLDRLRDPNAEMSFGEKLGASLQVTVLGVIIVLLALVLLYFAINIMEKLLQDPQKSGSKASKEKPVKAVATESLEQGENQQGENQQGENDGSNEELVAVITAAIAASMETSTHNIVVRNIVRTADATPAWGRAGRVEQINQMYRV